MTNQELIDLLQQDLQNERMHLAFYTQASVMVAGLHREELREFFEEEAQSELKHVMEFAELIVYLGGVPGTVVNPYPADIACPVALLKHAVAIEEEVANNYAQRLVQTHEMENSTVAYAHVFFEDQIKDSWRTAKEISQMIRKHDHAGN